MSNLTVVDVPPQSTVAIGFGPLVTGVMVQQLLLGVICSQVLDYYRLHYHKDPLFDRVIVTSLAVLNVFIGVLDFHVLYRTAVVHYGNYDAFDLQAWTMWLEPGMTAIVGAVAQVFFVVRCWRFTHSYGVVFFLTLLCLFALGSGLSVSISFFIVKRFSKLADIPKQITLWLVSTSSCDVIISGVLIAYLWRTKSPVQKTEAIISRLIRTSMETSSVTAIVAVLNFVFYKALPTTAYHLLPQFSMSRVYTMTVMYTLLGRYRLRNMFNETTGGTLTTGFGFANPYATNAHEFAVTVNQTTARQDDSTTRGDIEDSDEWSKSMTTTGTSKMSTGDTKLPKPVVTAI